MKNIGKIELKICIVVFVVMVFGRTVFAQKKPEVRPYTIATTYEKLSKDYPFIQSIQPLESDKIIAKENLIYSEIHIIPESPHSFWLMHPWFETTLNYTIDFLDKILKNTP